MSQDTIRTRLKEVDKRFAELDQQRVAALADGETDLYEDLGDELDALYEEGEELRRMLGRRK